MPNPENHNTYEVKGNTVKLQMGYNYIKTYDTQAEKWLGNSLGEFTNDLFDIAWIVRYFNLKEKNQSYNIPISTCRYSSQSIKLNVLPNIEWWVNFKYNAANPVHVYQTPNYGYRVLTTQKNQNQKKAGKYRTDKSKAKKGEYKIDLEAGFKYNGNKVDFNTGDGFPLINAINFLLKAYELYRGLTFADETEEKEKDIARDEVDRYDGKLKTKMSKRYRQRKSSGFPFRIEVDRPSFSGGIYSKYAYSKIDKAKMGAFYYMEFAANPLFGVTGKVDLLYFAQFIGPIGQALYRVNQVIKRVDYLTLGAVKIDYFLYLASEVKFNLNIKALEHHEIDGWGGGDLESAINIKTWLEAGVNVDVNIQGIGGAEASGVIRGEAKMDVNISHDKRSNNAEGWFKFNGLDAKIWVNFKVKRDIKGGEKPLEPNEEPKTAPDYVKKILDKAKPWKINIL